MGSIPQSPGARMVSTHRDWDTGFPEPFCRHGNTSLPHPEARIGPDACITADDIPVSRTRERRSFLGNKYSKRTISHGRLTPQQQLQQQQQQTARHQPGPSTMYSDSAILDSDADSPTLSAEPFMPSRSADAHYGGQFGRPSKDSYDDRRSSSSAHGPPKDVSTMMVPPGSPSSTSTTRSRGFLQRLRWHRD